jgi:hypothetical protein
MTQGPTNLLGPRLIFLYGQVVFAVLACSAFVGSSTKPFLAISLLLALVLGTFNTSLKNAIIRYSSGLSFFIVLFTVMLVAKSLPSHQIQWQKLVALLITSTSLLAFTSLIASAAGFAIRKAYICSWQRGAVTTAGLGSWASLFVIDQKSFFIVMAFFFFLVGLISRFDREGLARFLIGLLLPFLALVPLSLIMWNVTAKVSALGGMFFGFSAILFVSGLSARRIFELIVASPLSSKRDPTSSETLNNRAS